ncbi:MAG: sugar nucleotide-binding protein [Candidatus Omnitrophica bacterium]|nr:sugar nucleotide-binding protein [Candidatus Omnitrophota bacterium]
MKNKILLFGRGFIGAQLAEEFKCEVSDRRISSFKDAEEEVAKFKPDVIINGIGYTGRNVDDCEQDKDKTLTANTFVPIILAEAALRHKARLVHISSGCIYHFDYSRDKPVTEDKTPDYFELFYSRTKIYTDRALEVLVQKYPILLARIRVPLDNRPHPKNLLTKLINYKKPIDIPNSITYIPDFIKAMRYLIENRAVGIYNIVNKGALKYPELLEIYKRYVPDFRYEVIDYKKLNLNRTNLILSTEKLERTGFKVRDIHEVLEECVKDYLKF